MKFLVFILIFTNFSIFFTSSNLIASESLKNVIKKLYEKVKTLEMIPGKNLSIFLADLHSAKRDCVCENLHINECDEVHNIQLTDDIFQKALTDDYNFLFYEFYIEKKIHFAVAIASTICNDGVNEVIDERLEKMKKDLKNEKVKENLECFIKKVENPEMKFENCKEIFEFFSENFQANFEFFYFKYFYKLIQINYEQHQDEFIIDKIIKNFLVDYKVAIVANSKVSDEKWKEIKENLSFEIKENARKVIESLI